MTIVVVTCKAITRLNCVLLCSTVASTEAVNKGAGKGKKVNTTKGDKKLQQPEQEVGYFKLIVTVHSGRTSPWAHLNGFLLNVSYIH